VSGRTTKGGMATSLPSFPSPRWRRGPDSSALCLDLRYFSVATAGERSPSKAMGFVPRLLHLFGPKNIKRSRDQNRSSPHPLSVCGPLVQPNCPRKLNFFIRDFTWCSPVQRSATPGDKKRKKLPIPDFQCSRTVGGALSLRPGCSSSNSEGFPLTSLTSPSLYLN